MFAPLKPKNSLDSLPRKTADAVAKAMPAKGDADGAVGLIDDKVIPLLERIERNTRRGVAAAKAESHNRAAVNRAVVNVQKSPAYSPPLARGSRLAAKAISPQEQAQGRRGSAAVVSEAKAATKRPAAAEGTITGKTAKAAAATQGQAVASAIAKATRTEDRKRATNGRFAAGEPKSAVALRASREADAGKRQATALEGLLDDFGGHGGGGGPSDAKDAAATAVGGPLWGVVTELRDTAAGLDPDSYTGKMLQAAKGKALGLVAGKAEAKKPVPVKFDQGANAGAAATAGGASSLMGDVAGSVGGEVAGRGLSKLGGKFGGRFGKMLAWGGSLLGGGAAGATGGAASGLAGAGGGILSKATGFLGGGAGKLLGKAAGPLALLAGVPALMSAVDSGDSKEIGKASGGMAGSLGGGLAGAAIGTMILPGIGTLVGGLLGSFAGDYLGAKAGGTLGGAVGNLSKSVDGMSESVDGNTDTLEEQERLKAGGVNWSGGSFMEKVGAAWQGVKNAVTGTTVAPIAGSAGLGGLSAKYESGSKGSEAVGYDSTGGTSYGKYQIASKTGTMNKFMEYLKDKNPEAYAQLKAAGPADSGQNGQFAQTWKGLASSGKLGTAEHDFIKQTHFDPAFQGIEDKGLRDQVSGSKALQDVLWSTSVQHGGAGASAIMNKVYKPGMSQEELTDAVYAERSKKFGRSTPAVQAAVAKRMEDERLNAQAGLAAERGGAATPALASKEQPASETPMYVPPAGSKPGGGGSKRPKAAPPAPVVAATTAPALAQTAVAQQPATATATMAALKPPTLASLTQTATPQLPQLPDVSSLVAQQASGALSLPSMPSMPSFSKIEGLLSQIATASETVATKAEKDTEKGDTPTIPFEFDDTALALMAHDRC